MRAGRAGTIAGAAALTGVVGASALLDWATTWGSTLDEQAMDLPGDDYLAGGPPGRVRMTRAVTVPAPPDQVWPWLAQLGRGAGFYSFDRLDNGSRPSARHLVSWIPEPARGDATAIGYLRDLDPGVGLTWWLPGDPFLGAWTRMVFDVALRPEGAQSRLITRVSGDAEGPTAAPVLVLFRAMDSIMAVRQLKGLARAVEDGGESVEDETGERDQYQLYEVVYASGDRAGVAGQEKGARWHQRAVADEVIATPSGG